MATPPRTAAPAAATGRVLVLLPQWPWDASSGAARSMATIGEMLSAAGWRVACLATTASEGVASATAPVASITAPVAAGPMAAQQLQAQGITPEVAGDGTLHFVRQGVACTVLDCGSLSPGAWEQAHGHRFDALLHAALAEHRPQLLLTFGGQPADLRRQQLALAAGCRIVFGLRNAGYHVRGALDHCAAVLTPSRFLSESYRRSIGLAHSTALPTPIDLDDVLAPERQPLFFTVVNPSIDKGAFFTARLAEELGCRRPDLPLLVVESRGSAGQLVAAGLRGGFDLRRHGNLMFSPAVPRPRDIFAVTRALLVPSVWQEPSARVVAEALVNGVPPLVSNRGGLAESCAGAGRVLPLPASLTPASRMPVAASAVLPWLRQIERLADEPAHYQRESQRALAAGQAYRPESLAPRYVGFFQRVLAA